MAQAPHEITIHLDDLTETSADARKVFAELKKARINGIETELRKEKSSLIVKVPTGLPGPWTVFLLDEVFQHTRRAREGEIEIEIEIEK